MKSLLLKKNFKNVCFMLINLVCLVSCSDIFTDSNYFREKLHVCVHAEDIYARNVIDKPTLPVDEYGIGITLLDMNDNSYDNKDYNNIQYTTEDAVSWDSYTPLSLSLTEGKAVAYYPWRNDVLYNSIPIKSETQTDYMYSGWTEGLSSMNSIANFKMKHALANIRIMIKTSESYTGPANLTSLSSSSDAFYESASLDATTGRLTGHAGKNAVVGFDNLNLDLTSEPLTFDLLVVPDANIAEMLFKVNINGSEFIASSEAYEYIQGCRYSFTLTFTGVKLVLSDFKVSPWREGNDLSMLGSTGSDETGSDENINYKDYVKVVYDVRDNYFSTQLFSNTRYYANNTVYTFDLNSVEEIIIDGESKYINRHQTFKDCGKQVAYFRFKDNKIPDVAFYGLEYIEEVIIPDNIVSIGFAAFEDSYLTKLSIGNGVHFFGERAFLGCDKLTNIVIADGLQTIGNRAFERCSALSEVDFGNGVQTIGEYAFAYCEGLTSVTIPNSVKTIEDHAFYCCYGLSQLNLANGLQTIGERAFERCAVHELTIPNSVTMIGPSAFTCCYELINIDFGNGVQTIGDWAFDSCQGLTSVTIPNSVTTIGYGTFAFCSQLIEVNLGDGVQTIGDYAFRNCTQLTQVNFGDAVQTIGEGAFRSCSGLTQLNLGNGVQTIGKEAFVLCAGLPSLIIPNSVITIDERAFSSCKGLTELTIPNSVTTIGEYAFSDCEGLAEIVFNNGGKTIGKYAFNQCSGLAQVDFGNGVQTIGDYAFYNCTGLNAVNIPSSVQSIGNWAFGYCESITELNISSDGILDIGERAFYECTGLSTVTIPNSVKTLGNGAFCGCNELAEVIIKGGIQNINNDTFSGCSSLTTISIPNSVTTIGHSSFYYCSSLMSVTIPNSVTKIEGSAFEKCTQLTQVNLGNGLQTIEESAFRNCTALMQITLPKSVLMLGNYIFQDCSSLSIINSHAIVAPKIDYYTFKSINEGGVLNVPAGSETSYSTWMGKAFDYLGKYNWTLQAIL